MAAVLMVAAAINVRSVGGGARLVEVAVVAKLVPLVLFVVVGAAFVRRRLPVVDVESSDDVGHEHLGRAHIRVSRHRRRASAERGGSRARRGPCPAPCSSRSRGSWPLYRDSGRRAGIAGPGVAGRSSRPAGPGSGHGRRTVRAHVHADWRNGLDVRLSVRHGADRTSIAVRIRGERHWRRVHWQRFTRHVAHLTSRLSSTSRFLSRSPCPDRSNGCSSSRM